MDKKINALIKNYSDNAELMNKLVVTSFLRCHSLKAGKGLIRVWWACVADDLAGFDTEPVFGLLAAHEPDFGGILHLA